MYSRLITSPEEINSRKVLWNRQLSGLDCFCLILHFLQSGNYTILRKEELGLDADATVDRPITLLDLTSICGPPFELIPSRRLLWGGLGEIWDRQSFLSPDYVISRPRHNSHRQLLLYCVSPTKLRNEHCFLNGCLRGKKERKITFS